MNTDKERMLAFLSAVSTALYPNSISRSYIQGLPNSYIHSSSSVQSCPNNNRVHSFPNSNNAIHSCPHSINVYSCLNSNNNVCSCPNNNSTHSCLSNIHAINIHHPSTGNISRATSTNQIPQSSKKPWFLDSDTEADLLNVCRICQLPGDTGDVLFSPCRCSGSLKDVHYKCLKKWIEICTRKTRKRPRCELCHFLYIRQKRFKFHNWRLPHVNRQDKCFHIIFFLALIVMAVCAVITVMCFLSDTGKLTQPRSDLSVEEVVTLVCGVLFFASFFVAMTVEMKARHTIYRLFLRFLLINTEWHIEPYDKTKDPDCPKPYNYGVS